MKRKIFDCDTMREKKEIWVRRPITAAGILFKKIVNNEKYILLMKYRSEKHNYLDDFGGRTEEKDITPFDTAIRETLEESNNIINATKYIREGKYKTYYDKKCKYLSILIEENKDFYNDTNVFGDYEYKDGIFRELNWYKLDNDTINKVSIRIKYILMKLI